MTGNCRAVNSILFLMCSLLVITTFSGCASSPETPEPEKLPEPVVRRTPPTIPPGAEQWRPLMMRLFHDGFDGLKLTALFSFPSVRFTPAPMRGKLLELHKILFDRDLNLQIQQGLSDLGYTPGPVDGMAGEQTRAAIKAFQFNHGLSTDGLASKKLVGAIQRDLALPADQRPKPTVTQSEIKASTRVYKHFLTKTALAEAEVFQRQYRTTLKAMTARYGVPGQYIVGILRVETNFGAFLGKHSAFNILSSMALSADYAVIAPYLSDKGFSEEEQLFLTGKAREKGDWAYLELAALIRYAEAGGLDPTAIPGSIYGAIGICQFMPTNALKFGADGDGDGRVDLFNMQDAIFSIGSYFAGHGWQGDMREKEQQRKVVFSYNRSTPYVNTVMAVAEHAARHTP